MDFPFHVVSAIHYLLLLSLQVPYSAGNLYRYKFLETTDDKLICPINNRTCSDGSPHFLCQPYDVPQPQCRNAQLKIIKLDKPTRQTFLNAHNGIRSKVAFDLKIANMNLVYWSPELTNMALAHIYQCRVDDNVCNTIGEMAYVVGQNTYMRDWHLLRRWPGHVVRHWYLQLGLDMHSWQDVIAKYHSGVQLSNFVQLAWPTVEFVGCAASHMFGGIYIICYYYPAFEPTELEDIAKIGEPCTQCPLDRPTCSRLFIALCGIDVPLAGKACRRPLATPGLVVRSLLVLWTLRLAWL